MCVPSKSAIRKTPCGVLLCYITERRQFSGTANEQQEAMLNKIAECAAAGVDYIQLREKDLSTRELEALVARAIAALPAGSPTRLLINSRTDVALACGAHGVHLPAKDLAAGEARCIMMRGGMTTPVIGVSAHTLEEVALAESHGADFVVFGPVFEKDQRASSAGLTQLRLVCERPHVASPAMPILALGGVNLDNAGQCLSAGADGVAGIRLFQQAKAEALIEQLRALRK